MFLLAVVFCVPVTISSLFRAKTQCIYWKFTLDLYHSSDSWMFLEARFSYCRRTSLRAAVRSGLAISMSTCTCCCWCTWFCSSSISCMPNIYTCISNFAETPLWQIPTCARLLQPDKRRLKLSVVIFYSRNGHIPNGEAYLIMQLLEEVYFLLKWFHLSLQVQSGKSGIIHIL